MTKIRSFRPSAATGLINAVNSLHAPFSARESGAVLGSSRWFCNDLLRRLLALGALTRESSPVGSGAPYTYSRCQGFEEIIRGNVKTPSEIGHENFMKHEGPWGRRPSAPPIGSKAPRKRKQSAPRAEEKPKATSDKPKAPKPRKRKYSASVPNVLRIDAVCALTGLDKAAVWEMNSAGAGFPRGFPQDGFIVWRGKEVAKWAAANAA